jgi:hypothetical protein
MLRLDEIFFDEMFKVEEASNWAVNEPVTLNELWITLKPNKMDYPTPT